MPSDSILPSESGKAQEELISVLKKDDRFFTPDGELLRNAVYEAAMRMDANLIRSLLSSDVARKRFFSDIDGILVFDKVGFGWVVNNRQFLPDSYTRFKNKIGLSDSRGEIISSSDDVVLVFPYKDCTLEGGQTKEDQNRQEIFYNERLAPEEVDRLLAPKVFRGAQRYSEAGIEVAKGVAEGDNLIIKGNNLLVASSLVERFEGKIKCVYLDPPYNSDSESNTFCYNNTFNHSTWLVFMKNRLEVAKKLLRDDGVVVIAIDDVEYAHLKVLCDELFGMDNYMGTIVVQSNPSGRTSNSMFATCHEYALFYAKDINEVEINSFELSDEQKKKYSQTDDTGAYKWRDFMRTGGTSTPDVRPNSYYPIYYYAAKNELTLEKDEGYIEIWPIDSNGKKRVWRQTPPSFIELVKKGELRHRCKDGRHGVQIKDRVKEGMKPKTIWADARYSATSNGTELLKELFDGERVFSYPKSIYTVQDILRIVTNPGDIVMDFFGGSATTAHAVEELNSEEEDNRVYIIVEQMDYAKNVTAERVHRVIRSLKNGSSFVYCELCDLNSRYMDSIRDSKTEDELVAIFEEMKKTSFISSKVDSRTIEDNVSEFELLSIENKKRFLAQILDKNLLYVNYCDIDDKDFAITDEDKTFTRSFYGK